MKITIENFGPIHHCEFDLEKDFHLIVGENNVGKSYAVKIIYHIVQTALHFNQISYSEMDQTIVFFSRGVSINQENISKIIENSIISILNKTFVKDLHDALINTFEGMSVFLNEFSGKNTIIKLDYENSIANLGVVENQLSLLNFTFKRKVILEYEQHAESNYTNAIIINYQKNNPQSKDTAILNFLTSSIWGFYSEVSGRICSIDYIPASRSGLYQVLSAFGQIIAELSKSRSFLTSKIDLPGIPDPLSNYFIKLASIDTKNINDENSILGKIAIQIEREILKGKVIFDSNTKRLNFLPDNTNLKLDLSTTSSMVSELSPIVTYLRYVLLQAQWIQGTIETQIGKTERKPIIIIEEPETHLHPKIQIKLAEFFAALANGGVKMFITSHSNYIFNKSNNLILGSKININKIEALVFKMTDKGSEGLVLNIDELGIDDENFLDSAEQLYNEKVELIQKLNADV